MGELKRAEEGNSATDRRSTEDAGCISSFNMMHQIHSDCIKVIVFQPPLSGCSDPRHYIKSIVYLGPLNEENQTHRLVKNTVLYGLKCN